MSQSPDLTESVVRAVAEQEEVEPSDLPVLEERLDADTFQHLVDPESRPPTDLEFSYLWYQITVEAGRIVAIDH